MRSIWITLTTKRTGTAVRFQVRHIRSYGASSGKEESTSWVDTGDGQEEAVVEVRETTKEIDRLIDVAFVEAGL